MFAHSLAITDIFLHVTQKSRDNTARDKGEKGAGIQSTTFRFLRVAMQLKNT
jgi:hypothetical protein